MARKHTIVIRPDAAVEYVHTDALQLEGLGQRRVNRLSNVEWEDGEWVARDSVTGKEIARSRVRGDCLAAEVAYFEARQKRGIPLIDSESA